jgi:hypothetical protein
MMSECPSMWIYWKDKRGIREALEYDYPELLKNNPELQQALAMIKNGERAINVIMGELPFNTDD